MQVFSSCEQVIEVVKDATAAAKIFERIFFLRPLMAS